MTTTFDLSQATDGVLLTHFQQGRSQRAFDELVRRHGSMVWATALRVLRNEHDAEDAFQATFFALAKSEGRLGETKLIAGWLHEAAWRCAMTIHKSKRRNQRKFNRSVHDLQQHENIGETDPADRIANEELKSLLDRELAKLPIKLKTVLILCDLEGLSQRQAAQQLGVPARTLGDHLAKARRLLRGRLVRRGVSLSLAGLASHLSIFCQQSPAITNAMIAETTKKSILFAAGHSAADLSVSSAVTQTSSNLIRNMKTTTIASISFVAVLLVATGGLLPEAPESIGREMTLIVPNASSDAEGSRHALAGPGQGYRAQEIIAASEFASWSGPRAITKWSLRPDASTAAGTTMQQDDLLIRLSVTNVSPNEMSLNFADNITGELQQVLAGPWSGTTQSIGPTQGPKEFDLHFEFDNPFLYDPTQGNLLIDWSTTGGVFSIDQTSRSSVMAGMTALNPNSTAASSVSGPAPALITSVPESSSASLATLGSPWLHHRAAKNDEDVRLAENGSPHRTTASLKTGATRRGLRYETLPRRERERGRHPPPRKLAERSFPSLPDADAGRVSQKPHDLFLVEWPPGGSPERESPSDSRSSTQLPRQQRLVCSKATCRLAIA